jgi:hypothetical protein
LKLSALLAESADCLQKAHSSGVHGIRRLHQVSNDRRVAGWLGGFLKI